MGNIRTAIYNWLYARHADGDFIIRIEDTDQRRQVPGAVQLLLDALSWLGVDWDEGPDIGGGYGPYYQSQRLDLYAETCERLLAGGHAYRCYCSPERLAEMRQEQQRRKEATGYDRRCRDLGEAERLEAERSGVTPVTRFKMPLDGVTTVDDLVRDEVSFENRLVDDFVMMKSDGFPTYHLANVVDDHHMEISHVMRAEEWLPSIPRHLQLYRALDWEPPRFAHLPIILAPDRSKLSKRHGATSITEYEEQGYLPDAMINFLTLLGWSLDDKTEIISKSDLVQNFSVERVSKASAVFNRDKLDWMNGHYIRQVGDEELADALLDYWRSYPPEDMPATPDKAYIVRIVPLIRERLKTLSEAADLIPFFFKDDLTYAASDLVQKGMDEAGTLRGLEAALAKLNGLPSFDAKTIEGSLRPLAESLNVKAGQLFGSLRVATSGQRVAPPLFQSMEVLGRDRSLRWIRDSIQRLSEATQGAAGS